MQIAAMAGSPAQPLAEPLAAYQRRIFDELAPLNAAYESELGLADVITEAGV